MRYNRLMAMRSFKNRGMTLVETLIALAIFVAVIVAVSAFQVNIFINRNTVSSSLQTVQDAQVVLRTMLSELRSAAPAVNGIYTIALAGTSTLSFFSDPKNVGQTEEITYSLTGKTLYRSVIIPSGSPLWYNPANQTTSSLITNIRNSTSTPVFQYYDQNYTGTSSPLAMPVNVSSVRLVSITLTLDTDPNRSPTPRTYTIQVSLRNLKTNL